VPVVREAVRREEEGSGGFAAGIAVTGPARAGWRRHLLVVGSLLLARGSVLEACRGVVGRCLGVELGCVGMRLVRLTQLARKSHCIRKLFLLVSDQILKLLHPLAQLRDLALQLQLACRHICARQSAWSLPTSMWGSSGWSAERRVRVRGVRVRVRAYGAALCVVTLPLESNSARVHSLVMRRKYVLWRCALVYERLRCEPWRPWGWGETTRGPRRPFT